MLDTVVMSGDDVCCSVVFGTLVGVFVFSVMWSELLMTSVCSSCRSLVRSFFTYMCVLPVGFRLEPYILICMFFL